MLKTVKRIMSDLKENNELPIEGIKLYFTNSKNESDKNDENDPDFFTIHCDINIQHGIYAGITIHTILCIPPKYPFVAPAMEIAPNFPFTHEHHEHVLGTSICNDMLSAYAWFFRTGETPKVASGWSSGYTLNVILSQMQVFFADPDLPNAPSADSVDRLRHLAQNYKCSECSQKRTYQLLFGEKSEQEQEKEQEKQATLKQLSKQLICGITKLDISSPEIILGYPILMEIDRFNRIWPKIVLENISYAAYIEQIQMIGAAKLDNFCARKLRSANGELFNYWIPIYINEAHFQRALEHVKNAISVIRYGIEGTRETDFRAEMILEVLPCLMNKTIVHIINGTLFHSTAAIQAYCNFLRMYLRLVDVKNFFFIFFQFFCIP